MGQSGRCGQYKVVLALKRAVINNAVGIQCVGLEDVRVKEEVAKVTRVTGNMFL